MMSFHASRHSRIPFFSRTGMFFLPFLLSLAILFGLGLSVHLYRAVYEPGVYFAPATPKAQRSFSFNVPAERLGASPGTTLLLTIRKTRNSFGSTRYWHEGKDVLSVPLRVSSCGVCIRLALWDPGTYDVRLSDQTGHQVFTSPLQMIAPLALYRDDLILIVLIVFLSWGSGAYAAGLLSPILPSVKGGGRLKVRLGVLALWVMALGLIFMPYPRTPDPTPSDRAALSSGSSSGGQGASTMESEGRPDARPLSLASPSPAFQSGYLTIRHHMDSWAEYGRTLTMFEGPVGVMNKKSAFFLPPDDGRYFVNLWSPGGADQGLQNTRWVVRSIPVSPPFPVGLFSGLALFSLGGFLWGLLIRGTRGRLPGH